MHITVLMLAAHTWGYAYFDYGTLPTWALNGLATTTTGDVYTGPATICTLVNASGIATTVPGNFTTTA